MWRPRPRRNEPDHALVNVHHAYNRRTKQSKTTKTGNTRRVPIHENLLPLLRAMHAESNGQGWHDARATGVTWLAVAGLDATKIQRRAGHTTIETTMGYLREAESFAGDAFGVPFPPLPANLLDPNPSTPRAAGSAAMVDGSGRQTGRDSTDPVRSPAALGWTEYRIGRGPDDGLRVFAQTERGGRDSSLTARSARSRTSAASAGGAHAVQARLSPGPWFGRSRNEQSGVDGTRTRGLRRDRPAL